MTSAVIDAQLVKTLREKTNAGLMECKKALSETNGDLEAAIDVNEDFKQLVRDITLQIAAANPVCISRDQVPSALLARERAIYADQVPAGKPANIIEKIVDGKMGKFFSTVCLLEQAFIKNPDLTITQLIEEKNKSLGEKITIRRIVRYMVGEELAGSVV